MFIYKKDIVKELSDKGYTSFYLRQTKFISEGTMARLRHNGSITLETINTLCVMLECQPNDLFEIQPTEEEKEKYKLNKEGKK